MEFIKSKFMYVIVIIKIAITAFALSISTKKFPFPAIRRDEDKFVLDFNWTIESNRLLALVNNTTKNDFSTIGHSDKLEIFKLTSFFLMGCPGAAVKWQACKLNPAYPAIEAIAMRVMELELLDQVYAFQNSHRDDLLRIAFESSLVLRDETTIGYMLRNLHNYTKGSILEASVNWIIRSVNTCKPIQPRIIQSKASEPSKAEASV
jgi:hypothetical protein